VAVLYRNLSEFSRFIPRNKSVMCIDMGEKQMGVALSDRTQLIATAHSVYCRRNISKDIGYLSRMLKENEVGSIVIGLPLEMEGHENEWCEKVIHFANKVVKKCEINVYLQDERLSTFIAINTLKLYGVSLTKSKKIEDKLSACIILQRTLDIMHNL
jgi:putative holliday junction resolvase